jgi:predicted 3-demethylubiquinone-9 3-methyltransferase (glyoxalase superfamily)
MDLYITTFPDSGIVRAERYGEEGPGLKGTIQVAVFTLCGREFMCSDSYVKHGFTFTPSSSIFLECDSADAQEQAFNRLSEGGQILMPLDDYGFSQRFGWCNDRFGVSWQLNLSAAALAGFSLDRPGRFRPLAAVAHHAK